MPPHLLTVALGLALHLGLKAPPRHSRHGRPVATASLPTDLASSGSDEPLQDRPLTKLLGDGKLLDDDVRGADGEDELGALPPVGNLLRELRPSRISVVEVPLDGNAELLSRTDTFVNTFRGCAPYIKMHSGKVMVIHMASVLLDKPQIFDEMMEDIASMSVLGVRIVLVVGIRDQVDARLDAMNVEVKYAGLDRVSDPETLRVVQEVSGYARSRVEGSFARGVKGLARVMSGGVGIDVVGGNFYYTAQPLGVRNGIDYGATGEVRRVETEKVRSHLNNGEIVLMTSLGYSGSGDVFNVQSEAVAARAAAALGATKLIYLTPLALVQRVRRSEKKGEESVRYGVPTRGLEEMGYEVRRPPPPPLLPTPPRDRRGPALHSLPQPRSKEALKALKARPPLAHVLGQSGFSAAQVPPPPPPPPPGCDRTPAQIAEEQAAAPSPPAPATEAIQSMRLAEAKKLVEYFAIGGKGELLVTNSTTRLLNLIGQSVKALELGVSRAHIVAPVSGALLQELYTLDGAGTLISRDLYDGIRLAMPEDTPGILEMIRPLEAQGVLVQRDEQEVRRAAPSRCCHAV